MSNELELREQPRINPATVVGWGVDANPDNNPAHPMRNGDIPVERGMDWERPAAQPPSVEVLQSSEHNRRTAVFGTSTPPRGLSGSVRRQAFHKSEGKWSHWLMLLLADRIDVVEGVVDDLVRGRIPNIPAEMGVRSEMAHNMPGLTRKLVLVAAIATASLAAARLATAPRKER